MITLDYPNQPTVTTDDAERIDTLVRKGWTVRPDMPAFDNATQQCAWDGAQWVVSTLPVVVPEAVEMVQARLALHEAGITAAHVNAIIASLPDRSFAAIEWEFRPRVSRNSALVQAIGKALLLTDEQIDQLFIKAAQK